MSNYDESWWWFICVPVSNCLALIKCTRLRSVWWIMVRVPSTTSDSTKLTNLVILWRNIPPVLYIYFDGTRKSNCILISLRSYVLYAVTIHEIRMASRGTKRTDAINFDIYSISFISKPMPFLCIAYCLMVPGTLVACVHFRHEAHKITTGISANPPVLIDSCHRPLKSDVPT
jgi:hypothetical protein